MRLHLVTYATGIFLLRQWFLGKSALTNKVVDTVAHWNPSELIAADFGKRAPEISLRSRGSGFWAWKPFIIEQQLAKVPDGDIVLYCDVGRSNHFKLLNRSLTPLVEWMDLHQQDVLPGLLIPWKGPMSMWTKRDALVFTGMDTPEVHAAIPIQASFSLWRASEKSRQFVARWMDLCAQPRLVNDEKGSCGLPELFDFKDHRHDQSLLTLCCLERGIRGLDLGSEMPPIDTQHPSEVSARYCQSSVVNTTFAGYTLRAAACVCETLEKPIRRFGRMG
jgi:hypothetical protein